jgi:hypothetical protein
MRYPQRVWSLGSRHVVSRSLGLLSLRDRDAKSKCTNASAGGIALGFVFQGPIEIALLVNAHLERDFCLVG